MFYCRGQKKTKSGTETVTKIETERNVTEMRMIKDGDRVTRINDIAAEKMGRWASYKLDISGLGIPG